MTEFSGGVSRRAALALVATAASGARAAWGADGMGGGDVRRDVDRIVAWVAARAPQAGRMFQPGATPETVAKAERRLEARFPDDLRALYLHADGQPDEAPTVSDAFKLMTLADTVETAVFLNDFFPNGRNEEDPDHAPIDADAGIHAVWWSRRWIPVFSNGGGDYFCLDLDPAPGGATGQIVSYWHDETYRSRVAEGVGALLAEIADGLEAGTYELNDEMISKRSL